MPKPEEPVHEPLYRRILGADYDLLPPLVQAMHEVTDKVEADGRVSVTRSPSKLARALAELLDLPPTMTDAPARVEFVAEDEHEILRRSYDGIVFETRQEAGRGRDQGLLVERLGNVTLVMALYASEHGLDFDLRKVRLRGLRLPRLLWPQLEAYEQEEGGWYRFAVSLRLPAVGEVIRYEGKLKPKRRSRAKE